MSEKLGLPIMTSAHWSPGVPRLTGGSVRRGWSKALALSRGCNGPATRLASSAKRNNLGSLRCVIGMCTALSLVYLLGMRRSRAQLAAHDKLQEMIGSIARTPQG